jgi:hypothetical protein
MARPLITTTRRRKPSEAVISKKVPPVRPVKPKEKKLTPPERDPGPRNAGPDLRSGREEDNQPGLHVHCMACGFRMDISAEGIKALQEGGGA